MVCTGCCATLDHIVTHLFKQMSMKGKVRRGQTMPENDALVQVVKMHPEILQQVNNLISMPKKDRNSSCSINNKIFQWFVTYLFFFPILQMLSTVLNIIMFEDCRNQWSMSRPLLGLILLNEDYFQSLRDQVCVVGFFLNNICQIVCL